MGKYECSIENFINKDDCAYSICRKERQYAVYLHDILRKYKKYADREKLEEFKNIFTACSIPEKADIENVFYEATFMRDFFERNRRNILGEEDKLERILLQKTFKPKPSKQSNFKIGEK